MPNTGKPSLDCHLCRQRRVKCDLARPACQRCVKYGAVCPGYRDQHELVFRNANPATVQRRRKKRSAAAAEAPAVATAGQSPASAAAAEDEEGGEKTTTLVTCPGFVKARTSPPAADTVGSMVLHGRVTEHWTSQSVPLLLDVYSALDFLRSVYTTESRRGTAATGGPLLWSAHIFTRTYTMNVRYPTHVEDALRLSTQRELAMYMGKTLRAVNRALGAPGGAQRDDILATVWILANYEVLAGTLGRQQPVNAWQLHASGLYSILKARGGGALRASAGRMAFWPAFNIVQLQALIVNVPCPAETDEWLAVCEASLHDGEELTLRIAQYIARVCAVQARIMAHLCAADFRGASDDYASLRQGLLDADEAFEAYLRTRSPLRPDGDDVAMDVYMQNLQCAAVIKSNHLMQMLCNLLTHHAACAVPLATLFAHRRHALHRINTSAQAIVGSLPVAMEPLSRTTVLKSPQVLFDAMKLVFPLFLVAHIPATRQEHKTVAMQALTFIGREVGIRQALAGEGAPTMPLPDEARAPLVTDLLVEEPPWVSAPPRDFTLLGF
ncbi:hypothetical protein LMH87_007212 [Akanthomyces muscarius]|uniref:Zn(2)-C6 fungal-type domain-containing protein n=1 Tax=Akanthomyces muscarius TaxID=2231603 RepID=A0A9W8QQD7_AKAMU|nr:hypothetical protein LMH87_007212 [Akanthomyces muscarius]KAJ4165585.1 hypothetical protein LMH87_007212 [Akanthomyces muscarius]